MPGTGVGRLRRHACSAPSHPSDLCTPHAHRRGVERAVCAQQQAVDGWLPYWTQSWALTVDVESYTQRTAGLRVQDVIRNTAALLSQYSGR